MRDLTRSLWLLFVVMLAACSESDVVAIRLNLGEDGSGTVATATLLRPKGKGSLEADTAGAVWKERAELTCASGTFAKIGEIKLADIQFTSGSTPDGLSWLRATLPGGKAARWCGAMAPAPDDQKKLATTFDASGKALSAGSVLKLEIQVPGLVAAVGITPEVRGCTTDKFRERATLVVPIQRAIEEVEGGAITLDVTWKKK